MHKAMFKSSICLLLISALIYVCGEHALTTRELEKYELLEAKQQAEEFQKPQKTLQSITPSTLRPPKPVRPQIDIENVNFRKIPGLTPPSDRNVGAGLLLELKSRKILWGKNVTKVISIASLTKILTVMVALDEVNRRDDITLKTKVKITSSARSVPSSSFLRKHPHSEVPIIELLQSAMIKSANDSCQLIAEFLGDGDSQRFIAMMNTKARQLKLRNSMFFNPHGLPGKYSKPEIPDNTSTIADLSLLVFEMIEKYKEVFSWTSVRSLKLPPGHFRAVQITNTNPLIQIKGVNGLKTGYTFNAGWCLVTTCKRDGRYFVSIVTGCKTKDTRTIFSRASLLWGFKAVEKI